MARDVTIGVGVGLAVTVTTGGTLTGPALAAMAGEELFSVTTGIPVSPRDLVETLGKKALKEGAELGIETAKEVSEVTGDLVDVWRGVGAEHPGLAEALQGKATPRGGHSDPELHNLGDTESEFTSWADTESMAEVFARKHGPGGVVLHDRVPKTDLVESPDWTGEGEVLRRGPVTDAKPRTLDEDDWYIFSEDAPMDKSKRLDRDPNWKRYVVFGLSELASFENYKTN
jgi:hypothetical protein